MVPLEVQLLKPVAGSYEATEIFRIQIEPEKELLLIILKNEVVSDVTDAISDYLNINQDNAGIIFSVGIEEKHEDSIAKLNCVLQLYE